MLKRPRPTGSYCALDPGTGKWMRSVVIKCFAVNLLIFTLL
jgi:hypothetical protein